MTTPRIGVFSVVLLAAQIGFGASTARGQDLYVNSGGRRIELQVVDDQVGVVRDLEPSAIDRLRLQIGRATGEGRLEQRHTILAPDAQAQRSLEAGQVAVVPLNQKLDFEQLSALTEELGADPGVRQAGVVVRSGPDGAKMLMTDEIVAGFKSDASLEKIDETLGQLGLEVVSKSPRHATRWTLRATGASPEQVVRSAAQLYDSGLVDYSHPDFVPIMERRAEDPLFGKQWTLHNSGQGQGLADADVDAPEAWSLTRGNPDVVIAVLDDAIDVGHPDLSNRLAGPGWDFTSGDDDPRPGSGLDNHGTAVAGIAVAEGGNGLGISGACPECRLLPVRMLNASFSQQAEAFDFAVQEGASVITNSWGYALDTPLMDTVVDAIQRAARDGRGGKGAVILFAMNNADIDDCAGSSPDISSLPKVIAVSASTNLDRKVVQSAHGACMDVIAPTHRGYRPSDPYTGTLNVVTTDRTGQVGYNSAHQDANCPEAEPSDDGYTFCFGGTSAATPLTAGVAGLVLSANPNLKRDEVQRILESTADKIEAATAGYDARGFSSSHGFGRVNAHAAVKAAIAARGAFAGGQGSALQP